MKLSNLKEETPKVVFGKNPVVSLELLELSREMGLTIFKPRTDLVPFTNYPAYKNVVSTHRKDDNVCVIIEVEKKRRPYQSSWRNPSRRNPSA